MLHFKSILLVDPDWLLKVSHQSTARLFSAPQGAKWSTPSERAMKTELKTGVRLSVAFYSTYFRVWQVVQYPQLSIQHHSLHVMAPMPIRALERRSCDQR